MSLNLALPTRELARQMGEKWPQKASEIYAAVIRILSEE